jgi:DNA-directed RNA polymerase subunit RPC12/RpoP
MYRRQEDTTRSQMRKPVVAQNDNRPTCPSCRKPMVFKGKRSLPHTELAEIIYRCATCDLETRRMVKDH